MKEALLVVLALTLAAAAEIVVACEANPFMEKMYDEDSAVHRLFEWEPLPPAEKVPLELHEQLYLRVWPLNSQAAQDLAALPGNGAGSTREK